LLSNGSNSLQTGPPRSRLLFRAAATLIFHVPLMCPKPGGVVLTG
jgi:hypothetical protein